MTKVIAVIFSLLTIGAGYATYNDIGLESTNYISKNKSVRYGSGGFVHGYRYGK